MTLSLLTTFTATVCNGMHNSSMLVPYDETKKWGQFLSDQSPKVLVNNWHQNLPVIGRSRMMMIIIIKNLIFNQLNQLQCSLITVFAFNKWCTVWAKIELFAKNDGYYALKNASI